MSILDPFEDDDVEIVPIPMDAATRRRLVDVSREAGDRPMMVAASLLAALLREDEDAHIIEYRTIQ